MVKKLIQWVFSIFRYEVIKKKSLANLRQSCYQKEMNSGSTMLDTMHRLKSIGINPELIIDIGAAKGKWTEKAMMIWPDSGYLLIEPLKEQLEQIHESLKNSTKVSIIEAVAGIDSGKVKINVSSDLDGSGVYGVNENTREVPVIKLDEKTRTVNGRIILKLDTHGYEIPIFTGAGQTLEKTEAIIVEVYGFIISPTAMIFHELSDYLFNRGYRLFDIVDVVRRKADHAFWQADAVYLKKTHTVFTNDSYR
jgi:FkbM family methyltransferase